MILTLPIKLLEEGNKMDNLQWDIVVHSQEKGTKIDWKGLLKCKDLIFLWVRRNFVAQYKQTVLGPAWAIIQPFFTTVVYSIFFGNVAGLGAEGVPNFIFYLSGTIIWTLFANCLTQTSSSFIGNAGILGKVYFPEWLCRFRRQFHNLYLSSSNSPL